MYVASAHGRGRQEDYKFKAIFTYIASLRPAWMTAVPVSEGKMFSNRVYGRQVGQKGMVKMPDTTVNLTVK